MHLELDLRTPVCGFEFFWRKSYGTGQTSHYMQNHAKPYMQNPARLDRNVVEEMLPCLGPAAIQLKI